MKHLIETTDPSGLGNVKYDRLILDSTKNEIIYRGGGVINANGHSYVDLGLPSGLKWATMNVGATSETEVGDYFQWGSTTPNTDTPCDWKHAPFNNGKDSYNTSYFRKVKDTVAPNGVLAKEYDTAAQIMRGDWRMPTEADFQELLDNTRHDFFQDYKGSGANGMKFTSKINGNSIFFPTSGVRIDSRIDSASSAYVWIPSLSNDTIDSGIHASFYKGSAYAGYRYPRYGGMTVRGVL